MPIVRRALHRRFGQPRSDRGAIGTIVAVLLAGGVLLGMTAFVVDVGKLYAEREELQGGADAAAMDIALDCATGEPTCTVDGVVDLAADKADLNARDGSSGAVVCGNPAALLGVCADPVGNLTDCLGERPTTGNWVEVRTTTRLPDDSTILPPSFAQAFVGDYDGETVAACARVGWGSPSTAGFPLTFSFCEYDIAVAAGDVVTGDPTPANEVILYTHANDKANECTSSGSGAELPGGFGWVVHDDECNSTIGSDGTYTSRPGDGTSSECKDPLEQLVADRTPVAIPIFDVKSGTGAGGTYQLKGFAAFVITGYNLPGMSPKTATSWLTGDKPCKGSDHCVYGYFTQALVDWDGSFGTTPSLGAVVVKSLG